MKTIYKNIKIIYNVLEVGCIEFKINPDTYEIEFNDFKGDKISLTAFDFFASLVLVRLHFEKENLLLACNGNRIHTGCK